MSKKADHNIPVPIGSLTFTGIRPRWRRCREYWKTHSGWLVVIVTVSAIGAIVGYWLTGLAAVGIALLFAAIGLALPAARYKVKEIESG